MRPWHDLQTQIIGELWPPMWCLSVAVSWQPIIAQGIFCLFMQNGYHQTIPLATCRAMYEYEGLQSPRLLYERPSLTGGDISSGILSRPIDNGSTAAHLGER